MSNSELQFRFLYATDFDGTIARTFSPSPNNLDVGRAYELAIQDQFGAQALQTYLLQGGHNNRAPSEIIQSVLPSSDELQRSADTQALVDRKLHYLLNEVTLLPDGSCWPEPMPGFLSFWRTLQEVNDETTVVNTAVISSGHTPFIKKVFDVWDVPEPDILVTDDTLRSLPKGCLAQNAVKPSPLIMGLVRARWLVLHGNAMDKTSMNERIIYTGDDIHKDGQLARISGVKFVHVEMQSAEIAWNQVIAHIGIGTCGP